MSERIIITKLRRDDDGVLRARVSANGTTLNVHRAFGSWQTEPLDGARREVHPAVAARLQAKLPRSERGTR